MNVRGTQEGPSCSGIGLPCQILNLISSAALLLSLPRLVLPNVCLAAGVQRSLSEIMCFWSGSHPVLQCYVALQPILYLYRVCEAPLSYKQSNKESIKIKPQLLVTVGIQIKKVGKSKSVNHSERTESPNPPQFAASVSRTCFGCV